MSLDKSILEFVAASGKWVELDSIIESLNENRVKIYSRALHLVQQAYLEQRARSHKAISLSPRGQEALETGLVERILLDHLVALSSPQKISSLSSTGLALTSKELSAAIGILKRLSYIQLEQGNISLTRKARAEHQSPLPSERVLTAISQGQTQIDEKLFTALIKRDLILQDEVTSVEVKITSQGLTALSEMRTSKSSDKQLIRKLTPELLVNGQWKDKYFTPYNINADPPVLQMGRKHQYLAFLDHLKQELVRLGFIEMEGPLVELEWWNFDVLYQPQDHPAREWTDCLSIKCPTRGTITRSDLIPKVKATHESGWKTGSSGWRYDWDIRHAEKYLLRPQGTALSARYMANLDPPVKYFSMARCFRYDRIDATHLPEFTQVEGIVAAEGLSMRDLLGMLQFFAEEIAGAQEITFMPDTYPFTEPSVQLLINHPKLGEVELGGAGIFREEVTKPLGIEVPVIAWGLGVNRIYMTKYGIHDIRQLFSKDLSLLRNQEVI
ncbi:MAG: phenylalanine--tRNA ligase subunit alpha [Candidatus Heimdallarchaeota archaeon]|nr:phenylalanine--tRNA ligase subunit alpha [Candidatus Heimdallarchaeota archaeon]